MKQVTYEQLEAIAKAKGYRWFTGIYDLNVWGIRSPSRTANAFDDTLAIAYMDKDFNKRIFTCPMTVDPGLYYLKNPMNPKGCAILPEGQYLGLWMLGKHKGYTALVQRKPIQVYRDNDRNAAIGGALTAAIELIGLDLHRALEFDIAKTVDRFSAGCQVIQVPEDFNYIISLVKLQVKYIKSAIVSYTLISERLLDVHPK